LFTQTLISENKWPQGGLPEIQRMVISKLDMALKLGTNAGVVGSMTKQSYNMFMEVLITGCYTEAVQGRVGGLMDLKMDQVPALLNSEAAYAKNFKTSSKYLLQIFIMPPVLGTC